MHTPPTEKQPFTKLIPFEKVLVPIESIFKKGLLPLIGLGCMYPVSVLVANHGTAIFACVTKGKRNKRARNGKSFLKAIYVK